MEPLGATGERGRLVDRARRAQSECWPVLLRADEELRLLARVCRVIVERAGYRLARIVVDVGTGRRRERAVTVTEAGLIELDGGELTRAESDGDPSPIAQALASGAPVILQDLGSRPVPRGGWRQRAVEHGCASLVALPICGGGATHGLLVVGAVEPLAFDSDETAILADLALDLARAIGALRHGPGAPAPAPGLLAEDVDDLLTVIAGRCQLLLGRLPADDPLRGEIELLERTGVEAARLARQLLSRWR